MSYHDPALLRQELAFHKAHGLGWDRAWLLAAGGVIPRAPDCDEAESVDRFTYLAFRDAYLGEGKRCALTPECAADAEQHTGSGRGKSRPSLLIA